MELKEHFPWTSCPLVKSVEFAFLDREELLGPLVVSQAPGRPFYGSRNNGQERQSFAQSLGFKVSVVHASGLQVMAGG